MRAACRIEIGLDAVAASWRSGRGAATAWREPLPAAAPEHPAHDGDRIGAAVRAALARVAPKRRWASPRVAVTIADPFLRMAVMRFATLPPKAADRRLVVAQRFCREHRLDPRTTIVASAAPSPGAGERAVLVSAMPRAIHDAIFAALAERQLHADQVGPEFLPALSAARSGARGRAIFVFFGAGYATLAILSEEGGADHLATLRAEPGREPEFIEKAKARCARYAAQASAGQKPLPIVVAANRAEGHANAARLRAALGSDPQGMAPAATDGALLGAAPAGLAPPARASAGGSVNFSLDLGRRSRALAMGLAAAAAAGFALAAFVAVDTSARDGAAALGESRVARLAAEVKMLEAAEAGTPGLEAFARLKDRILALGALDFAGSPAVGELLDTMEGLLPDAALLTSLNYDRSKGQAEIVAISPSGGDLTKLFEVLHRHETFGDVRLVDKKHTASGSGAQAQQVHLVLKLGARPAPPARRAP